MYGRGGDVDDPESSKLNETVKAVENLICWVTPYFGKSPLLLRKTLMVN